MEDIIVRGSAANGMIRCFGARTTNLVEQARIYHETSPVMTAAFGRLLTGGAMMGAMMKSEKDILTIKIECQGPAKGLLVTADAYGHVKGFVNVPVVNLPPSDKGKLDVGGALGLGVMSVIKDIGLKEPYIGQTILVTSEIAEDLTYYFANSEQVPSSVGLGVLMNKNNTVANAGGFIVQLMPGATDEAIDALEKNLAKVTSVTALLEAGKTPEEILGILLEGLDLKINDTIPAFYSCDCSKERFGRKLIALGKKELKQMISSEEDVEVGCVFCNKKYSFSNEDIVNILTDSLNR